MKKLLPLALISTISLFCAAPIQAGTLLDDLFLLGNRTNQNLPSSSQWFNSSSGTLTNAVGSMTGNPQGSSCEWITYFMPAGNPSGLHVGDTLKVTMNFSNLDVNLNGNNTSGLRFGIFNYSAGASRVSADSTGDGSAGANVQGYAVFMNFGQTNGIDQTLRINKRFGTTASALLATTTGIYTNLGNGGGAIGAPGFSNNVPYTMVFSITRTGPDSVILTNSFTGPGLNMEFDTNDVSGTFTNFDAFAVRPANSNGCAAHIIVTEFKVEGPPGVLAPPSITASPSDMTLTVSDFGIFNSAAAGAVPLNYQWYFNNASTPLANQTNQNLVLTNAQMSQAGQYFVIVTNAQGAATSSVANLTVTTPTHTPRGVIVNDTFQNNSRVTSVNSTTSDWVASTNSTLGQATTPGPMVGFAQTNVATMWVANFVDTGAANPLDIGEGDALRITLTFTPTNVAAQNTSSLRFGIFDFYDGARILSDDGDVSIPSWTGSSGGTNARGYMITVNFGTLFGDGTPIGINVRNNLNSPNLMSTTGDFLSLGSGPSGMSNAPGFLSGSQYTMQITAARITTTLMQISTLITGPQINTLGFLAYDNTYFTHRFSALAIRPNRNTDSADAFKFSNFKVEVISATNTPVAPFQITSFGTTTPTNFFLNWQSVAGKFYLIQNATNLTAPIAWRTNTSLAAGGSTATWTNLNTAGTNAFPPDSLFFRVVSPPQP